MDTMTNRKRYAIVGTGGRAGLYIEALATTYAGVGELVLAVSGSSASMAKETGRLPTDALIVGIVNHYGTPVEMEVEGDRCNAGSILDLMVTVGSNSHARRFRFRGDENPLRDIGLLFEHDLGENGISSLPAALSYLADS